MAKVTKIKVRMYRAGTGDFFLLRFMKGTKVSFKMMIDCGCISAGKDTFTDMIGDLKSLTGSVIDLLVVTHEHADHINGFEKSAALLSQITFKKVWFAWTEDDQDAVANDYRANRSELGIAVNVAVNRLNSLLQNKYYQSLFANEVGGELMLRGKERFIQSLSALNELNPPTPLAATGSPLPTMIEKLTELNIIKDGSFVECLLPGETKTDLPGAEGIRFYALGPPRDFHFLNRTEMEGESFEQREEKSKVDFAFLSAVGATNVKDETAKLPFEPDHEAKSSTDDEMIRTEYKDGGDWRKIDYDWLYSAGSLAMRYERSINNTSLVLAIQFEDSERVLLFPGDAEFGSWQSWHLDLEWPVKVNGDIIKKNAEYFLNNTVFYKVGHHLSQNGTAKGKGVEMMTSEELTAMATLDFKKINKSWLSTMPNDLLAAELIRKTKGKLYFVGDRTKILPNIKTNRVTVKPVDEKKLNDLNKKFDGKDFVECQITGHQT